MTADKLLMVISANTKCPSKNVNRFHDRIGQAMLDLLHILQTGSSKV
jgi:hypothetical protein